MKKLIETSPILFFPAKSKDKKELRLFLRSHKYIRIIDEYQSMLEEVCAIRNPQLRKDPVQLKKVQKQFVKEFVQNRAMEDLGTWVYFPWMQTIVHFLQEDLHEELRTARNRNLITADEQKKYRDCRVAVAGLSVGSHAAASIALQGGGHEMRLADLDTISGTNLNRIRAGFQTVGIKKTDNVAHEILELNPYAKLRLFPKGLNEKNLETFLTRHGKVDVLIEEMDDLLLKVTIREQARRLRIPVITAADDSDGIILDIERFDLDPALPLFGGRTKDITKEKIKAAGPHEMAQMITQLIDPNVISTEMKASVADVGKTLYSWPQLGGAAQLAGVVLAYAVRMIATAKKLESGRTVISLKNIVSHTTQPL